MEKLTLVKNKVNQIVNEKQLKIDPKIIVVTKTFPLSKILPLLNNEHIDFGDWNYAEEESTRNSCTEFIDDGWVTFFILLSFVSSLIYLLVFYIVGGIFSIYFYLCFKSNLLA